MQFGIGILGSGWNESAAIAAVMSDKSPAHPNFNLVADKYSAKLAAETVLSEPYVDPDLSDDSMLKMLALCARPVKRSELEMVRKSFKSNYSHLIRTTK